MKLGDVCQVVSGATPKTSVEEYWDGDINWVTPADLSKLSGAYISETPRKITEAGFESCATNLLPENSVLLSSRAPIGHVAINTVPMATNQGFKSLIPSDQILPKFLYYWLLDHKEYLQSLGVGATFKELSKKTVENIKLDIPPLEEQAKQVEIRDLQSMIAQKRERQQDLLQELEKSVFTRLFIKKSYTSKPLSYLADIWDCPHSTPKWTNSGNICLRTTNLGYGDWKWADIRYIDDEQFKKRSRGGGAKPGDIIISREGTVGVAAIVPNGLEVAMGQRLVQIRCKDSNIIPEFLLGYLLHSLAPEKISAKMVGSTAKHLNVRDLKNLPTPIPLLEDQILYKKLRELISYTKI
ncbi:restriction endonuclease subunit S [Rothia nasimurium]|uniref:restriction endonuclease subunit S n=1 Tax=Rothia nasimurium TaxID=85336 RepID=UPI001F022C8E|nr:restriction endonuclease subunit S [Rothia nasimurium]